MISLRLSGVLGLQLVLSCFTISALGQGAATVILGPYPGWTGTQAYTGRLIVTAANASAINIEGQVAGLDSSSTGGWHIHEGRTCSNASLVGGHLYYGATDPWNTVTYTADAQGNANVTLIYPFLNYSDVIGRAMVFHAPNGSRVACGIITAPYEAAV